WRFVPRPGPIMFYTPAPAPSGGCIDEKGGAAGDTAPPRPPPTHAHYRGRVRVPHKKGTREGGRRRSRPHNPDNTNGDNNNTHPPYWPGGLFGATNELAVASLGIAELATAPCSLLTNSLTVQFTAAHSNLGGVSIVLEGPGGPYHFDLSPTSPEDPGENW